jgi:GNAT superfamily N-acetyltransferase
MTDTPEPHVRKAILGSLIDFNNVRASQPENYRPLVIVLSNPDTGGVLGGLWGETNFAYLHVDLLFVPEALRGTGLGRQILLQAEQEAIARARRGAWLDTHSFQARGFYERLGYAVSRFSTPPADILPRLTASEWSLPCLTPSMRSRTWKRLCAA